MSSYNEPSFQQRVADAAKAKEKALERLRSRPPADEQALAERKAASLKKEAAKAEKIAEKIAAKQAAAQVAEQAAAQAAAAAKEAETAAIDAAPVPLTEAERKAARDARYANRKKRK
jgi:hypothetical protein